LKQVLILLAHGSRDPDWSTPVERLIHAVARRLRGVDVALAFLESTLPDLETQVAIFAELGYRRQTIVPVFLGSGRHLKRDLAKKTEVLRKRHKGVRITVERALGERPRVIEALAAAIAAGIPSPRRSARRS
jgi:sirohydrochlorin cobaltochelatase